MPQAKRRYRLLVGIHQQNKVIYDAQKKNVIESETDLVKKFGPGKFAYVDNPANDVGPSPEALAEEENGVQDEQEQEMGDGLDTMTVDELKEFAEKENVNLHGVSKKQDIIARIRESLAG